MKSAICQKAADAAADPVVRVAFEEAAAWFALREREPDEWHGVLTVGELLSQLGEMQPELPVALLHGSRCLGLLKGGVGPEVVREHHGSLFPIEDLMGEGGREVLFCVVRSYPAIK